MESLRGKSSLFINAGDGLGFIVALEFARHGADVTLHDSSAAVVLAAVERLQLAVPGSNVKGISGDLTTDEGLQSLLNKITSIEVLVCDWLGDGAVSFSQVPAEPHKNSLTFMQRNLQRLVEELVTRMAQHENGRAFLLSTSRLADSLAGRPVMPLPLLPSTETLAASRTGLTIYSMLIPSFIFAPVSDVIKSEVLRTGRDLDSIVEQFDKDRRPVEIRDAAKSILSLVHRIASLCV